MKSYPMELQVMLVQSCFAIRLNRDYEDEYDIWNAVENDNEDADDVPNDEEGVDLAGASILRDEIAQAMWAQYVQYNLLH